MPVTRIQDAFNPRCSIQRRARQFLDQTQQVLLGGPLDRPDDARGACEGLVPLDMVARVDALAPNLLARGGVNQPILNDNGLGRADATLGRDRDDLAVQVQVGFVRRHYAGEYLRIDECPTQRLEKLFVRYVGLATE